MNWRVVHFIDEDSVEAVPNFWIRQGMCLWPPWSGPKLKHSISNCDTPCEKTWNCYKVRLIGPIYENLEKARVKAIQAEATSDLNSDCDGKRKSKKKKYKGFDNDSSSEEPGLSDTEEEGETVSLPILRSSLKGEAVMAIKDIKINGGTMTSSRSNMDNFTQAQSNVESQVIVPVGATTETVAAVTHSEPFTADTAFKKHVVRFLHKLDVKLDQIQDEIAELKLYTQKPETEKPTEEKILHKFDFPLKCEDDLLQLEKLLEINENKQALILELAKIGGINYKVMVKRIMAKMFSNELMVNYSWIGFKKKNNFSVLAIATVIVASGAVELVHHNTQAEIEHNMGLWLTKAKERTKLKNNN